MLALLLACSSPTATLTTAPVDGLSEPTGFAEFATGKLQKSVDTCYGQALQEDPELAGTVVVTAIGSHGILNVEADSAGPLVKCVKAPLEDSRTQRSLADGDNEVGAVVTVTFTP